MCFCSSNSDLKLHCQFVFRTGAGILGSLTCKLQYKLAIGLARTNLPSGVECSNGYLPLSATENFHHSVIFISTLLERISAPEIPTAKSKMNIFEKTFDPNQRGEDRLPCFVFCICLLIYNKSEIQIS